MLKLLLHTYIVLLEINRCVIGYVHTAGYAISRALRGEVLLTLVVDT
jgi:hypothetical protein